jgi:hypothetical protein
MAVTALFLTGIMAWVSNPLERSDRVWTVAVVSAQTHSEWLDHAALSLAEGLQRAGRPVLEPTAAMNYASSSVPMSVYTVPDVLVKRIKEVAKVAKDYLANGDDQKALQVLSLPYPGYSVEYFLPSMPRAVAEMVGDICLYGVRAYMHMAEVAERAKQRERAKALHDQAREYTKMCYSQLPDFTPNVNNHPDGALRIAKEVGADILRAAPNQLELYAPEASAGCGFVLNGRRMARAPRATIPLALGNYLVQLECRGKRGLASAITVQGKVTHVLVNSLPEIPQGGGSSKLRYIHATRASKLSLTKIAAIATAMRVEELVTLEEIGEHMHIHRYSLQGVDIRPVASVRTDSQFLSARMDVIVRTLIQGQAMNFTKETPEPIELPKHPTKNK